MSDPSKVAWADAKNANANDTSGDNMYLKEFRKFTVTFSKICIVAGIVMLAMSIYALTNKWSEAPSWMKRIPCSFEDEILPLGTTVQRAQRVLELNDLLPTLASVIFCIYLNRPANTKSTDQQWTPPHTLTLILIFTIKIIVTVTLFTVINFKLPPFTPYNAINAKACTVTASLIFYPPPPVGDLLASEFDFLRIVTSAYFANPQNYEYKDVLPSVENYLKDIIAKEDLDLENDGAKCKNEDDDGSVFNALNKFVAPTKPMINFCAATLIAVEKDPTIGDSQMPMRILFEHMENIINAIGLTSPSCQMPKEPVPPGPVDAQLDFTDVCDAFKSASYSDVKDNVKPFLSEEKFNDFAEFIKGVDDDFHRELSCVYLAMLPDPKNGYSSLRSLMCPAWVKTQQDLNSGKLAWTNDLAGDAFNLELRLAAIGGGALLDEQDDAGNSRGFNNLHSVEKYFPDYARLTWGFLIHEIGEIVAQASAYMMNDRRLGGNLKRRLANDELAKFALRRRHATGRRLDARPEVLNAGQVLWSSDDPMELTKYSSDYNVNEMTQLFEFLEHALQEVTDKLYARLDDLDNLVGGGIEDKTSMIKTDLDDLAFWMTNGVKNDFDDLGLMTDSCGPINDGPTCTSTPYKSGSCVWWNATTKCGTELFDSTMVVALLDHGSDFIAKVEKPLLDLAQETRVTLQAVADETKVFLNEVQNDTVEKLNKQIMDTTQIAKLSAYNTVRLSGERTAAAVAAGINKVKFLIGEYIGFLAVSKLAPFSLAIIGGVLKGVVKFKALVTKSKSFTLEQDMVKINRFTALMMLVAGSVSSVPMLVIPIFVFQGFANYFFMLTVLGVIIYVIATAAKGYLPKCSLVATAFATVLMILGLLLWVTLDAEVLLEALMQGKKFFHERNAFNIVKLIVGFVYNFVWSQMVTLDVMARITASMFGDFGAVCYVQEAVFEPNGCKLIIAAFKDAAANGPLLDAEWKCRVCSRLAGQHPETETRSKEYVYSSLSRLNLWKGKSRLCPCCRSSAYENKIVPRNDPAPNNLTEIKEEPPKVAHAMTEVSVSLKVEEKEN